MRVENSRADPGLSCQQCHADIPADVALSPEGADLIGFHCGTGCYESFVAQVKSESISDAMILASPLL